MDDAWPSNKTVIGSDRSSFLAGLALIDFLRHSIGSTVGKDA